jgi:hypothetical protein
MNRTHFPLALAFVALLALPCFAQSEGYARVEIDRLEPATMTAQQALAGVSPAPRTPLNISSERPSTAAVVLGAANTAGLYGSYFTTDLFLLNPMYGETARINIFAMAPGVDNLATAPPSGSITLGSRSFTVLKNVMAQVGATGGAALLIGIDSANSTSLARFTAWAYTSTPGLNGGRYGVNIQAIGTSYQDSLFDGWCVGANVGSGTRTNIGVFNYSTTGSLNVTAYVYNSGGGSPVASIPITVPRASFVQFPLGNYVSSLTDGVVWFRYATGSYSSYMVVNDNITNDANFQLSTGW